MSRNGRASSSKLRCDSHRGGCSSVLRVARSVMAPTLDAATDETGSPRGIPLGSRPDPHPEVPCGCVPSRCEHPLALRRLRQPHPVRPDPHPPYDGVLALRPGGGPSHRGLQDRPRGRLVGDVPMVRPLRRHRAGLTGGSRRVDAVTDAHQDEPVGPLTETVRVRVVAITADALGRLDPDQLPGSLRRVASFAPTRRARLAAGRIAAVLENDEDFRERVATQVRTELPELAAALDAGVPAPAADPVDVAALAYL